MVGDATSGLVYCAGPSLCTNVYCLWRRSLAVFGYSFFASKKGKRDSLVELSAVLGRVDN